MCAGRVPVNATGVVQTLCATDCGRPSPSSVICSHCSWLLERELGDVGALGQHLAAELDVALSRQVRIGGGSGGRRSAEKPLPYDATASEALAVLRSTLVAWVRVLAEESPDVKWPADTLDSMAAWLLSRMPELASHEAAAEAFDELTSAVANARRAVDRPVSRIFAGICGQDGCPGSVYGRPGREWARCDTCGASFEVATRHEEMRADLDGRLFTAAEIATLGVYLGDAFDRKRTRNLLTKWAERGQLEAKGLNPDGHPTYRFGDAMDRLVQSLRQAG